MTRFREILFVVSSPLAGRAAQRRRWHRACSSIYLWRRRIQPLAFPTRLVSQSLGTVHACSSTFSLVSLPSVLTLTISCIAGPSTLFARTVVLPGQRQKISVVLLFLLLLLLLLLIFFSFVLPMNCCRQLTISSHTTGYVLYVICTSDATTGETNYAYVALALGAYRCACLQ